ncbi:MAG: hypothetical protein ACTSUE_16560 [Promethearchaeota archaeon]
MNEIKFRFKTKGYTKQDEMEQRAITIFRSCASNYVRVEGLNEMDKIPNHDGSVTILDNNFEPINNGISIQVKKMGENLKDPPRHQVTKDGFLGSCERSPTILACVDIDDKICYWEYIDFDYVQHLKDNGDDKATIYIHFDKRNIMKEDDTSGFLDQWREIAEHQSIASGVSFERLELMTDSLIHSMDDRILSFQEFLNDYNRLLDAEFYCLKQRYFPRTWKKGIAFGEWNSDKFKCKKGYIIYEIPFGVNDVLIRKLNQKKLYNGFLLTCSYDHILNDPKGAALKEIRNLFQHFIDEEIGKKDYVRDGVRPPRFTRTTDYNFPHTNPIFMIEYIWNKYLFWDQHHFGLESKDEYSIDEVVNALDGKINNPNDKWWSRYGNVTLEFLKNNYKSKDNKLRPLIGKPVKIDETGKKIMFPKEWWVKNSQFYFKTMPYLYNEYLDFFFPLLKEKFGWFPRKEKLPSTEFNKIVTVVSIRDGRDPIVSTYYLKAYKMGENPAINASPRIFSEHGFEYYLDDDPNNPFKDVKKIDIGMEIEVESEKYKVVMHSISSVHPLKESWSAPFITHSKKMVKRKFDEHFEQKQT